MITKIKQKLIGDIDKIHEILEEIGCHGLKLNGDKFRFGKDSGGTNSANIINVNTLQYTSFSSNVKGGDILTLVSEMLHNNDLGKTIRFLANRLNINIDYTNRKEVKKPFGGFWNGLSKIRELDESPPTTYPISVLDEYGCYVSKLFLDDSIDAKTQEVFGVGYDIWTDRVTINWYDVDGSLCGIVGRINKYDIGDSGFKYLALLHINKSKLLFGLNINYADILSDGRCYVFESEKSTMQMYGFDFKNSVSIGCKTLSVVQAKNIKSMFVDCVLAFDEGVTEDEMRTECNKVKIKNPFFTNKVGYIYDREGKYLKRGSKCSPSDLGKDIFEKLIEECIVWI